MRPEFKINEFGSQSPLLALPSVAADVNRDNCLGGVCRGHPRIRPEKITDFSELKWLPELDSNQRHFD